MKNSLVILFCFLTVLANGLIGYFFPPNGIMLTPVVLTITSTLITSLIKKLNIFLMCLLAFLFVALNDISIKLYSGGLHDIEGLGWIHLLLFIGLVPTFGILLTAIFNQEKETASRKVVAVILFIALVAIHLQLFGNLGLGRHYGCLNEDLKI